ncbi:MAG: CU044_2847 family protein [Cyanobacteria bacterium P01_F01_bin.4]
MPQLVHIKLEDGSEIYIEATDDVQVPAQGSSAEPVEQVRGGQKGIFGNGSRGVTHYPGSLEPGSASGGSAMVAQNFKALESTIKTYTNQTLNAFKELATANVDKVTLQFGIRISGEAGVPYVTKGAAESNLNITVECSFKDESGAQA